MEAESAKKLCYIVVALLLELCSIAALSLGGVGALKINDKPPTSEKLSSFDKKGSSPSLFSKALSRSTASARSASVNTAASTEATGASVEAAPRSRSTFEKQSIPEAPRSRSASVSDFAQYSAERKRVGEERQAAHEAKLDALKAHSALAHEAKVISTEAAKLREGMTDQAETLKSITEQQTKNASIAKQARKRSSKAPTKSRSTFDQELFVRIQHEIKSGQVKSSIRAIQASYKLGFTKARMYHERLQQLGIISSTEQKKAATQA